MSSKINNPAPAFFQTRTAVTGSRLIDNSPYTTGDKPTFVTVTAYVTNNAGALVLTLTLDGAAVLSQSVPPLAAGTEYVTISYLAPPGSIQRVTGTGLTLFQWHEVK